MTFTDEDLHELLKACLIPGCEVPKKLQRGPGAISKGYIEALLTRLEIAENVVKFAIRGYVPTHVLVQAEIKKWKEMCGQ